MKKDKDEVYYREKHFMRELKRARMKRKKIEIPKHGETN